MPREFDEDSKRWSRAVFKRDGFRCVACGKKSRKWLNAHHLNGWNMFPELRLEVKNGVTLCSHRGGCHDMFHREYGKGNNTEYQFDDFLIRFHRKRLTDIKR